jgi:WD40 repeat protein
VVFALSPNGVDVAIGTDTGDLALRSVVDATVREDVPELHSGLVRGLAFTPDGATVVSHAVDEGVLHLTSTTDWTTQEVGMPWQTNTFALSPDGETALFGPHGLMARPLRPDVDDGEGGCAAGQCATLVPRIERTEVQFSNDGLLIAIAHDAAAWVWDTDTGATVGRYPTSNTTRTVAISPDGAQIVVGNQVIDRVSSEVLGTINARFHAVFSEDGSRIGTDMGPTTIGFWDAETFTELTSFNGLPNGGAIHGHVLSVDMLGDGEILAGAALTSVLVLHADGTTARFDAGERVTHVALHPDGESIMAATGRTRILSWDLDDPEAVTELGPESANTVTISPDGEVLVTSYAEGEWLLVESETGTPLQRLPWPTAGNIDLRRVRPGQEYTPAIARFSPDGDRIATGTGDGMVQIWCRE